MLLGVRQEEMWTGWSWIVRSFVDVLVLQVAVPYQTLVRILILSETWKPSFNECCFFENRTNILDTYRRFSCQEWHLSSDLPFFQTPDNVHNQRKWKWSSRQCGMIQEAHLSGWFFNQFLELLVQALLLQLLKPPLLDQWRGTVISAVGFSFAWFLGRR